MRNKLEHCEKGSVAEIASRTKVRTSDFCQCLFGLKEKNGTVVPNTFSCNECNMRKGVRYVTLVVLENGDRLLVQSQENGTRGSPIHFVMKVSGDCITEPEDDQKVYPKK
jgi:hypothetical protein